MISNRLVDKIEGMLSGWYPDQWPSEISWEGNRLLVAGGDLAAEIVFNLRAEEIDAFLEINLHNGRHAIRIGLDYQP